MSGCKTCSYDMKPARYFSDIHVPYDYHPEAFSPGGESDTIGITHPDYAAGARCWQKMRDAVEGQDAMKANAFEMGYVLVPEGLLEDEDGKKGGKTLPRAGQHYIERGRFPEVPVRHLIEVEGQLFGDAYEFEAPDELMEVADALDAAAGSLEDFARDASKAYFKLFRYGVYVQWNEEESRPEFIRYEPESIVNWKIGSDGHPKLIVIEEHYQDDDVIYSHVTKTRRIQLAIEEGVFTYRVFIKDDDGGWLEDLDSAVVPSASEVALDKIPFVLFGRWDVTPPPLKPIVETAIDYFRAHVEWSHGLFYSAHPTLFLELGDGGAILGVEQDADGSDLPYDISVGATRAHAFMNGKLAYAETSGSSHAALKDRVTETRDELAGLGARSFVNYAASNVKATTEAMQQSGERGAIAAFSRDISLKITECLSIAAQWMGLDGDDVRFRLYDEQNDDNYDTGVMGSVYPVLYEGIDRGLWSAQRVRNYTRAKHPDLIPDEFTDEDLAREIGSEASGFVVGDIGDNAVGDLDDDA